MSSFAEQMLVHENAVVKIREDMPLDRAALIGCGVMTGVGAIFNTAKVAPGETVVVIGCGGIGMAAINGAAIVGAGRIIAVDNNPVKLQLATKLGATDIVDVRNGDPVEQVKELTKGQVHHAIEAVGAKITAEQAFQMFGPGGVATIIGMIPFGTKIELHGFDFLRGEKKVQGSLMGSNRFRIDIPRLVEHYLKGRPVPGRLDFSAHQALGNQRRLCQHEIGEGPALSDHVRRLGSKENASKSKGPRAA
jgi:S-(hydroxymethyl)glutathione dehydrogenase / alcohol dehydrogenase